MFQIDVVRKICSLVRSNGSIDRKESPTELFLNQSEEKEGNEHVEDDIEIIPSNVLQDDFVQININEYNEQSNILPSHNK